MSVPALVVDRPQPSVAQVLKEDIVTPDGFWRLVVKSYSKGLSWAKFVNGGLTSPFKESQCLIKKAGKIRKIWQFPAKVKKLSKAIDKWKNVYFKGISLQLGTATANVCIVSAKPISAIVTIVKVIRDIGLLALSSLHLRVLSVAGLFVGLTKFSSSVRGVFVYSHDSWLQEIGTVQFNFSMMQVANKIIKIVLGVFAVVELTTGAVPSVVVLSTSTISYFVSTFAHYYKKVYL